MSGPVFEVPPKSRKWLRDFAGLIRKRCGLTDPYFPIVEFVEILLPRGLDGFELQIGTRAQMGKDHGQTWPDQRIIRLRKDIYERAHDGHGRDRLTVAHEVGHLFLHGGLPFARAVDQADIPAYRSSEWQANCFAGELLFFAELASGYPVVEDAVAAFGISQDAAETQIKAFRKEGLI